MVGIGNEKGSCLGRREFARCDFKDKRLTARAISVADSLFSRPGSVIWGMFPTNAERKAAYNFFKNPKVTVSKIQSPHFLKTFEDMSPLCEDILVIQDTTYCSFKDGKAFEGTETYLNKTEKGKNIQGFAIHSSLALTSKGIPLGLVAQEIYQHQDKEENHKKLPIEQKESYRWLLGLRVADGVMSNQDNLIHICDREGDIFEVLSCAYQNDKRFIIRQSHDRITGSNYRQSEGLITQRLACVPWVLKHEIEIYDQQTSQYVKRILGVKYHEMTFPVPKNKVFSQEIDLKTSYQLNVVEVCSLDDLPKIQWILLTNLPINTQEEILKIIHYYRYRWHIENYHKVLKSGFKVEDTRLQTLKGIKNLISLLSILSVKLYYLIHLSRIEGEKSCETVLSRDEWETLSIQFGTVQFSSRKTAIPPTLKQAITMIAQLGGYMNRKRDSPPGIIVIWRGWLRLAEMAAYHKTITHSMETYG